MQQQPKKAVKPTGGHTPIQNSPQEETEFTVKEIVSEPPSEGSDPRRTPVNDDGSEAVEGYQPRAESAEVKPATIYTAPVPAEIRDIGELTFGVPTVQLESIILTDDRVQITNTSAYPWRVHSALLITAADNSTYIGTGWFIGPRTLVTAAHCVFIKSTSRPSANGWVKSIQVMPGRNGSTLPYGSVTSTDYRTVTGWTNNTDLSIAALYDYAVILLPTPLGNTVGWFGYGVYSDADLTAAIGNVSGYPGDKPSGTQWYHTRKVVSVNNRKVYYDIDTAGGQSGSAVYRVINGACYGVAIHAYGTGVGMPNNSGTRITNEVHANLTAWRV